MGDWGLGAIMRQNQSNYPPLTLSSPTSKIKIKIRMGDCTTCNNETKPEQLSTFALSSPTSKAADWAGGRWSKEMTEVGGGGKKSNRSLVD